MRVRPLILVVLLGCGSKKAQPGRDDAAAVAAPGWWCAVSDRAEPEPGACLRVEADCTGWVAARWKGGTCAHQAEAWCFDWVRVNGDRGTDCVVGADACAAVSRSRDAKVEPCRAAR